MYKSPMPTSMQMSATLNIGKLTKANSIKSVTLPNLNLSIKLPTAPPSRKPMAARSVFRKVGPFISFLIHQAIIPRVKMLAAPVTIQKLFSPKEKAPPVLVVRVKFIKPGIALTSEPGVRLDLAQTLVKMSAPKLMNRKMKVISFEFLLKSFVVYIGSCCRHFFRFAIGSLSSRLGDWCVEWHHIHSASYVCKTFQFHALGFTCSGNSDCRH